MQVQCGNCDWIGDHDAEGFTPFVECCDLYERLSPGAEVPAGDCPECRAFCYLVPDEAPATVITVTLEDGEVANIVGILSGDWLEHEKGKRP